MVNSSQPSLRVLFEAIQSFYSLKLNPGLLRKTLVMTFLIPFLLFFCETLTFAQTTHFDSIAQQQQFKALTEELRCLVCQNESLWDSTAPLAKDLRDEIASKIKSGASNAEIKHYLVARYGEFILFKPTLNHATYILWIMPFILLVLAFLIVALRSRRIAK